MSIGIEFPSEQIQTFFEFLSNANDEYRQSWERIYELIGGRHNESPEAERVLTAVWGIENAVAESMFALVLNIFKQAEKKPWVREMIQTDHGSVLLFAGLLELDKQMEGVHRC